MSYDYVIPEKKSNGWQMIFGLLVLIMSAATGIFIKVIDQKDEGLKNSREAYEKQIDQLDQEHTRKVNELNVELATAKADLRSANDTVAVYRRKSAGLEEQISVLQAYLDKLGVSDQPKDSVKTLAMLKGELKEYEVVLNDANYRISSLENAVKSLETDLSAARQRINELKDSLAISDNEVQRLNQELISTKNSNENAIRLLEQGLMLETYGDALPYKRRFMEEKFRYYQNARSLLINVRQAFANPDLLNTSLTRLTDKMEELSPGSTTEAGTIRRSF